MATETEKREIRQRLVRRAMRAGRPADLYVIERERHRPDVGWLSQCFIDRRWTDDPASRGLLWEMVAAVTGTDGD